VGQRIEVQSEIHGEIAVFDTDRTFGGQDGRAFTRDGSRGGYEGLVADRLFETDPAIERVFLQFNVISVRRRGGWDEGSVRRAAEQIEGLFLVY
jgi:hypothetical protein